jgi:SagB-type dehydrogenase family enzyme
VPRSSRPAPTSRSARTARFRRSRHVVSYWEDGALILHDYRSGRRFAATPLVIEVLDAFDVWRPATHVAARLRGVDATEIERLVSALADAGALDRVEGAPPADVADAWESWLPAAGLFHGATRDMPFWPRDEANAFLARKAERTPPPPPVTQSTSTAHAFLPLPPPALDDELSTTLRARRTWRRFGSTPIALPALANLLGLTWGVQAWVDLPGHGRTPLKTSPSGGARHSIEAYVAVRRVTGIPRGLYHYDSAAHALVRVGPPLSARGLAACVPHQDWMAGAGAIVFMTAVFARVQWRYPFARAYRTVIAEAGHHAQTFCLLATAQGLAPFCTMALADTRLERALGVDGVREAVMYAVGVGSRPGRAAWAPWPSARALPLRRDVVPGRTAPIDPRDPTHG